MIMSHKRAFISVNRKVDYKCYRRKGVLKGNFAKKIFFYMFFLMYKYGCLYVY